MNSQTDEEKSKGTETKSTNKTNQAFSFDDMSRMMNTCCMGRNGSDNMMGRCCKSFIGVMWWFALIPLIFAGSALLLGYYLNSDSIRVLWMVGWGSVVGIVILGMITMRIFWTKFNLNRCCRQNFREESK